jgi:hypothetical protein
MNYLLSQLWRPKDLHAPDYAPLAHPPSISIRSTLANISCPPSIPLTRSIPANIPIMSIPALQGGTIDRASARASWLDSMSKAWKYNASGGGQLARKY